MKNTLLLLGGLTILSILSIAILYFHSEKINSHPNGFNRTIDNQLLKKIHALQLPGTTLYVAGRNNDVIYFGDKSDAARVTFTNAAFTAMHQLQLNLPRALQSASANLTIRNSQFYITDYATPSFYHGELLHYDVTELLFDSAYFDLAVPLNTQTIIGRVISTHTMTNILFKQSHSPVRFEKHYNILTKQREGIFSTDGMLTYNEEMQRLFYTYYYRNTFLCLDTALNIIYTGHTIDTTTVARLKAARITSDESITVASPPFTVNSHSLTSGNYLFIQSELLADNEDKDAADHSSVIDVYHAIDGKYVSSFYLPKVNGIKSQHFYAYGNTLISIHGNEAVKYRLSL